MEPFLIVLVPGVLGGVVLALAFSRVRRWVRPAVSPDRRLAPPSVSLINMAAIRVEGPGGLGLVAMAAAVAIAEPHIRVAMTLALLLGIPVGAILIAWRRHGPLPSSHHRGAHAMLPLER